MKGRKSGTYNTSRIIGCNNDILQSEFVQVERVPSQLRICAIKTLAAPHKFDEQRDRALDDRLRLGEQGLVLSSCRGTLGEKRTSRSALPLGTSEEVCTRGGERSTVDRERGAAFDIEARVCEWAERRKNGIGVCWRGRGRRVTCSRENDRSNSREGKVGQLDHELRELLNQRIL